MNYHHQKGSRVSKLSRSARSPSLRTGFFATRGASAKGSGASSLRLLGLAAFATAALLALTAAPALAARGHVLSPTTIGAPCPEGEVPCAPGKLKEPSAVAVNEASGEVYVLDQGNARVETFDGATNASLGGFDGSETPAGIFEFPGEPQNSAIAVDNSCALHTPVLTGGACASFDPSAGDVYLLDAGHSVIDKFKSNGEYIAQVTGLNPLNGIEVNAKGELWVYTSEAVVNFPNAQVNDFSEAESRPARGFGSAQPGLAVDSKDNFYVHIDGFFPETDLIYKFDREGNKISGFEENPIDLEPPTGVAAEVATNDLYVDNTNHVIRFDSAGRNLERLTLPGTAPAGTGLAVDSAAQTLYVADFTAGEIDVYTPEPPSAPAIESTGVSDVTAESATLSAEVNPRGAQTEYRFEYGPCAAPSTCSLSPYQTSVPVPDGTVGSDFEIHSLAAALTGLEPGTAYHFRLAAHNSHGEVLGPEKTFTTQSTAPSILPDSRQWELVSPPEKRGANLLPIGGGFIQAAAAGGHIAYLASAPTEPGPGGNANRSLIFSTRGPAGWSSRDLATPHGSATGLGPDEYPGFSSRPLPRRRTTAAQGFPAALPGRLRTDPLPAYQLQWLRTLRQRLLPPAGHRLSGRTTALPTGDRRRRQRSSRHRIRRSEILFLGSAKFRGATPDIEPRRLQRVR